MVKDRINQIIELGAAKFSEDAQRAIDHIRQMVADDPRFAECTTLGRYLDAVTASLRLSSDRVARPSATDTAAVRPAK